MTMADEQEWVWLYGDDGKKKASFNVHTGELVVKDRGKWHRWNLATMVKLGQDATDSQMPIEMAVAR